MCCTCYQPPHWINLSVVQAVLWFVLFHADQWRPLLIGPINSHDGAAHTCNIPTGPARHCKSYSITWGQGGGAVRHSQVTDPSQVGQETPYLSSQIGSDWSLRSSGGFSVRRCQQTAKSDLTPPTQALHQSERAPLPRTPPSLRTSSPVSWDQSVSRKHQVHRFYGNHTMQADYAVLGAVRTFLLRTYYSIHVLLSGVTLRTRKPKYTAEYYKE